MGYNQFSKLVTNAPQYKAPISEDTLVKGAAYQEQGMQKIKSELQSAADSFLNIQAMSPQDEEIMNQRKKEFQESVKGLNMSSLSNPQTLSQANSIISKFANDPDIQGIAQRSGQYKKLLAEKKDAEDKGKSYFNYGLDDAQKYLSDGNYYKDKRFNNLGGIAPDEGAIMEEAKKVVTPKKVRIDKGNGEYSIEEQYDPKELKQAIEVIGSSKPNYQLFHQHQFEDATKDVDWDNHAVQYYQPLVDNIQSNIDLLNHHIQIDPKNAKTYQNQIEQYQEEAQKYTDLMQNPYTAQELKNKTLQDYKDKHLNSQVAAMDAVQQGEIKMGEHAKMQQQLANNIYQHTQEKIADLELSAGIEKDTKDAQGNYKYYTLGKDGKLQFNQNAYLHDVVDGAHKKELEIAQAKSDIILNRQKELEQQKQEGKVDLQKFKNTTKGTKTYSSNVAERVVKGLGDGTLDSDKDATALKGMILANKHKLFNPENGQTLQDPNIMDVTIDPNTQDVTVKYDTGIGSSHEYTYKYSDVLDVIDDSPNYTPNSSANSTPIVNTIEEYNKLPSGTKYKDSQGNIATKK